MKSKIGFFSVLIVAGFIFIGSCKKSSNSNMNTGTTNMVKTAIVINTMPAVDTNFYTYYYDNQTRLIKVVHQNDPLGQLPYVDSQTYVYSSGTVTENDGS